jgi:hypothetical protein
VAFLVVFRFCNDLARFPFPRDEFRNDQETIGRYTMALMTNWRTILAWAGGLVGLGFTAGSLWLLRWGQGNATPQSIPDLLNDVSYLLIGVALTLVGMFLTIRRGDNAISWVTLGGGLSLSLVAFLEQYASLSLTRAAQWPGTIAALWLSQWMWVLPYVSLNLLLIYYPTGQLLTPRWRWVVRISLLAYVTIIFVAAFSATLDTGDPSGAAVIPNPVGFLPAPGELIFFYFIAVMIGTLVAAMLALGLRFHRARGIEREQMKWLLFAGSLFIAITILDFVILDALSVPWSGVLTNLVSLGIPLAIAIAVLRYRLFDIDVIIRRTTSYAIITGLLALVYFGSIVVLQRVLTPLIGESDVAVVLSTLLIAALFLPVRRRVQDTIDRRFNRTRYNAEKTLEAFAATVRNETDLDALLAELVTVIQQTMQPESVSVWLREPNLKEKRGNVLDNSEG